MWVCVFVPNKSVPNDISLMRTHRTLNSNAIWTIAVPEYCFCWLRKYAQSAETHIVIWIFHILFNTIYTDRFDFARCFFLLYFLFISFQFFVTTHISTNTFNFDYKFFVWIPSFWREKVCLIVEVLVFPFPFAFASVTFFICVAFFLSLCLFFGMHVFSVEIPLFRSFLFEFAWFFG